VGFLEVEVVEDLYSFLTGVPCGVDVDTGALGGGGGWAYWVPETPTAMVEALEIEDAFGGGTSGGGGGWR